MTALELELVAALRESVTARQWAATVIGDIPPKSHYMESLQEARDLIAKAEAQPEQEPVATLDDLEQEIYENTRQFVSRDVMEWMLKRYYTTPPQCKQLFKNVYAMTRYGDMSISLVFRSCAAASEFEQEAAHGIKGEA